MVVLKKKSKAYAVRAPGWSNSVDWKDRRTGRLVDNKNILTVVSHGKRCGKSRKKKIRVQKRVHHTSSRIYSMESGAPAVNGGMVKVISGHL